MTVIMTSNPLAILQRIRIVLVNTSHPGNIGATARAMANMGLQKLVLVQPVDFPSPQASARAAGADSILDQAQVFSDLAMAVASCKHVYGASARLRSIAWPQFGPAQLGRHIKACDPHQDIAIVFGRERSGLTNEELDLCHALVHIPVDDAHRSLNLASAVMVLAFSVRSVLLDEQITSTTIGRKHASPPATSEQMTFYFQRLDNLLNALDFYKGNAQRVMRKLRRLYFKAQPSQEDIRILLGTLTAIEAAIDSDDGL